jgi:hypothetical protein
MQLDAFIFKLLILLTPGFICFSIFRKIAVYRRESKKDFGFYEIFTIIAYSLIICILYDAIFFLINLIFKTDFPYVLSKLVDVNNGAKLYNAIEIGILCLLSIISGYIFSILETRKIINKIAVSLKITHYYGDTDVWTSFCANKNTIWIYVRDHKLNLIYYGLLEQYSDPGEERELIITNVMVFSEDGKFCYNCPQMYVCRQVNEITLEIPQNGEGEKDGKNGKINDESV